MPLATTLVAAIFGVSFFKKVVTVPPDRDHARIMIANYVVQHRLEQWPPMTFNNFPSRRISVAYPAGKYLNFGQKVSLSDATKFPHDLTWESVPGKLYLLMILDPDVPSSQFPVFSNVLQFLAGNIQENNVKSGKVLVEYPADVTSLRNVGVHRCIFLVFEQRGRVDFSGESHISRSANAGRLWFSVERFAEKYGLGEAHAGTYFLVTFSKNDMASYFKNNVNMEHIDTIK